MDAAESGRSRSKREYEYDFDARSSRMDDEGDREDADKRRSRSSKSRRHGQADEVEELEDGRRKVSGEMDDLRKRSGSGDDDDYDRRRESRSSKYVRKSPNDRGEKRSSDAYYKDRDGDSSRQRRDEESEWDSLRKESSREKSLRYPDRKDSSRERERGQSEEERNPSHRRWDEADVGRKGDESSSLDKSELRDGKTSYHDKHGSARDRNESGEKGGRSSNREERREVVERSKNQGYNEDTKLDTTSYDDKSNTLRDDKHQMVQERSPEEKAEKHRKQSDAVQGSRDEDGKRERSLNLDEDGRSVLRDSSNRENRRSKRSRSPERNTRYHREFAERDQAFSDSDNERSMSMKGSKDGEEAHGGDRYSKGRDSKSSEKYRDHEGYKEQWRRNKDGDEYDPLKEWDSQRSGQERVDSGNFHNRPGYRKESRIRSEGAKGSDSIEIRPNRNLDFGREGSVSGYSGRRAEVGSQQNFGSGTSDDECGPNYGYADDLQERYHDDGSSIDQISGRNSLPPQSGRGRMTKGAMTSNRMGAGEGASSILISPHGNSPGTASFNRASQGPKGGRPGRGGRGRMTGRDSQPVGGVPMPMMGPPFGPLGLPPGPIQPIGANIPHSPGPPIGPGVFIPSFPGPLVWPGARGVDMNMLAVPPNIPPIRLPGPGGPRFGPNMGAGSNHSMYLNQSGPGRGTPPNLSVPGFNPIGTPNREMPHDKAPSGWAPPRNNGSSGKAPSRGEQNDYSQNFVDTGMRPQNFIRELELTSVVEDYPKLRELIQRKDEIVAKSASPPMYYKCDLREHVLSPEFFGTKFDVILVDPPWEEYVHRAPGITDHIEYWTFEEIMNLKIEAIADTPSFIFLWVGDGVGLEMGRQCLKKWGFRRCEDICWVKTNKRNATPGLRHDSHTLFQHSKEHCLMGIKGTVRRSTDGHIIHANIDTDIIIAEEPSDGSTKKPDDMYKIIEHFALGRRRLELFGEDHNIRSGWLTVGKGLSSSNFNREAYVRSFADKDGKVWQGGGGRNPPPDAPHLVMTTPEIESLRPKSPPAKSQQQQQQQQQSIPPLPPSNAQNLRRLSSGNSPQNPMASVHPGFIFDTPMSDPVAPAPVSAPWASSPMVGLRVPEELHASLEDRFFDGFGFNSVNTQNFGDRVDLESHKMPNFL
ncbi:methyltransferase-like protein 1 [Ananas comosus]|uniref:Methyltransferase-like protein 1 n=1 Tax=Ananas comosus TaxID=4615 RepID=A0A6P5FCT2_ANACO|nr:methyltransferase-like protein 1 [Ananas comosus]